MVSFGRAAGFALTAVTLITAQLPPAQPAATPTPSPLGTEEDRPTRLDPSVTATYKLEEPAGLAELLCLF